MKDIKVNSIIYLDIMEDWDYEKNMDLSPETLTKGSNRKVYWFCKKHNFSYTQIIRNKVNGQLVCPMCLKERNLSKKSLAITHPYLINEWVECENPDITPYNCTASSKYKVKWKCNNGHVWDARIKNRANGSKCIYCVGQKTIKGQNDLSTLYPELAEQWDYEKNNGLLPYDFLPYSNKKIWWKCKLGHSWDATIGHRVNGTGCPKCYSQNGTSFPEQAICFYLSKCFQVDNRKSINGCEVDIYIEKFKIGFEYDGIYFHSSDKAIKKEKNKNVLLEKEGVTLYRIKESVADLFDVDKRIIYVKTDRNYLYIERIISIISKILKCDFGEINILKDKINIYNNFVQGIKENSIAYKYPELVKEWNYDKNMNLKPDFFTTGSTIKVWWKCKNCNSEYQATINHRVNGSGCPYCVGKKINESNNLAIKYPNLKKYWDNEKNKNLKMTDLYFSSRKKVWWKCPICKQSFLSPIYSRIRANSNYCPNCRHKELGEKNQIKATKKESSITVANSDLIKEWDFEKNIFISPDQVSIKSGKEVWWRCLKCNYGWKSRIINRTNGNNCPNCYKNSDREKKNINVYLENYDYYGNFESAKKLCEHFKIDYKNYKSYISNACNKKTKFLKKYYLRYANNDELK